MIMFIDPFIVNPVSHCFNHFVSNYGDKTLIHMPHVYGVETLKAQRHEIKAYIIAGSQSNVTDPLPWHRPLADFLLEELKNGKPVLGCCFGHQLMCHAFGSHVDYFSPEQIKMKGLREMKITRSFWNVKEGEVFDMPVTHRQVVKTLAEGLISVSTGLTNDMVIHESLPFLSSQGHPEASRFFCENEIGELSKEEVERGVRSGQKLVRSFLEHFRLK
jgi:GMP synthase-like glutamine amidotransferase